MFAGNDDRCRVRPILNGCVIEVENVDTVTKELRESYQSHLRQKITDEVLCRYNITLDDYRTSGLNEFGQGEFARLNSEMDRVGLDLELLVFGFDEDKFETPHILIARDSGIIETGMLWSGRQSVAVDLWLRALLVMVLRCETVEKRRCFIVLVSRNSWRRQHQQLANLLMLIFFIQTDARNSFHRRPSSK